MKIAKMVPMNYTVVYVEDEGKYSAYRRHSSGEWVDGRDDRKISGEKAKKLEDLFAKESGKQDETI